MVKAADSGKPDNLGVRRWSIFSRPTCWRVSQTSVNSVGVVVVDIFAQQTMQVPFVHYDHVIQHLSANTADPSFGNPILPWTPKGRSSRLDSNILDRLGDSFRKYRIVIVDEESWRVVVWERLAELLHDPGRSRMGGDPEVKDLSSRIVNSSSVFCTSDK